MKQREKVLLAALLAVLGLWQGSALLNAFVFSPVEEKRDDIAEREKRIATKSRQLDRAIESAARLKAWNKRSLPPDPVAATSLYQNWLVDLAVRMKLANVSVSPDRNAAKPKGDAYYLVSGTMKAEGTLTQLVDFLYEFRKSGLLHRVSRISLATEQHTGDPALVINLSFEGLALKDSPARKTLLSDPRLADLVKDRYPKDRKEYASLTGKNLFVRGYNGPSRPAGLPGPDRRTTDEDDVREFVYLVGSFSTGGVFDATLYDRSSNKSTNLTPGAPFSVAGIEGKVLAISVDSVTLEIKGERWRLELGKNLRELEKLSPASKVESGPSDASTGTSSH